MRFGTLKLQHKQVTQILNLLISIFFVFNILVFFKFKPFLAFSNSSSNQKKDFSFNTTGTFSYPGQVSRRIPPPPPDIEYTQEELEEAIVHLNLPTWSRSYVKCDDPESEVTCSQIVKAHRAIKKWKDHVENTPIEDDKYIITKHYFDGVGNRISIDTVVFLLAMMNNRSMVVEGSCLKGGQVVYNCGNAYEYAKGVYLQNQTFQEILNTSQRNSPYYVQTFDGWWWANFDGPFKSMVNLDLSHLIYSEMLYTQYQMSQFAQENFGMHAVYFLSNYLVRIPEQHLRIAKSIIDSVPKDTRVFGVHLRFQFPGQFYSYSVETTMKVVKPFLWAKLREKKTVFAFASDSQEMEDAFRKEFGPYMIQSNATRKADFDHVSALTDIALLMMCDECLLSYRSTFSSAIATRMGKRAWFVEKESPGVFQASNSQATTISMLFHNWDVNDWQTNRRFRHVSWNEKYMKYYYKYFII